MPIYQYQCGTCDVIFEELETKATDLSWQEVSSLKTKCPVCGRKNAKRIVSSFKMGFGILDTTKQSGYETDDLTLGKIIDEEGIPYEFKEDLRKREEMLKRQKSYSEELKKRSKKYKFNPFKDNE